MMAASDTAARSRPEGADVVAGRPATGELPVIPYKVAHAAGYLSLEVADGAPINRAKCDAIAADVAARGCERIVGIADYTTVYGDTEVLTYWAVPT